MELSDKGSEYLESLSCRRKLSAWRPGPATATKELARHCCCRVRSVDGAEQLVQEVLHHNSEAADMRGADPDLIL